MRQFEHFPSLTAMFFARAAENGDKPFLAAKRGGVWQKTSWAEAARQVASLAAGLKGLGLKAGDRVMLVSENRPEWCLADLAIMAAGCVTVPTYTTNGERDHQHIIEDSGASAVIVSNNKLAQAVMPAALRATHCHHLIGIDDLRVGQTGGVQVHRWSKLLSTEADVISCAADAQFSRDALACIIYTSGTGGSPRGVMQHHGAILLNVAGCIDIIANDFSWEEPEVFLSFLPLSHAYEHSGGQFLPIGLGGEIWYAESLEKLVPNMAEARPTIMVVVPRLFEVIRARILKEFDKRSRLEQGLLRRALALGAKDLEGGIPFWDQPVNLFIDKTLRPKIKAKFGGRLKALVSGGAPLNPEIGAFFHGLGLNLLQGYGQTEAGPVVSCNRPRVGLKMDTVGPPLKGVEVKIAEDGEILVRGELVMHGYWRNEPATAAAVQDGWLHTGDIGHLDGKGRVVITDRKKDIIVNDKGENISPQKVEGMLTLQPEIFQAMISGDKRPYLVGLIVPDPEWALDWAQANGEHYDLKSLCDLPAFRTAVMTAVDAVNKQLTTTEKVRKIVLTPDAFTVDNEMMTPKQSIRRHVIKQHYGDKLSGLYKN